MTTNQTQEGPIVVTPRGICGFPDSPVLYWILQKHLILSRHLQPNRIQTYTSLLSQRISGHKPYTKHSHLRGSFHKFPQSILTIVCRSKSFLKSKTVKNKMQNGEVGTCIKTMSDSTWLSDLLGTRPLHLQAGG